MGARLQRRAGSALRIAAHVSDPGVKLELVTSGGKVVATGDDDLRSRRDASAKEGWYYVRARRAGKPVAYSSPVWIEASDGGLSGQWYAGDDHVHTCFSHDAYCPPDDDNTGPDTFYSSFGTVAERFAEAAVKGLDFLIISDHNDIRAQSDPDFGSMGVVGMPAYEASLAGGHAQMMGARKLYDKGNGGAEATRALAASLRADGGSFQANHPGDNEAGTFDSCPQADNADWAKVPLNWKYGFSVLPNTIEVWNATTLMTPSELYWECWLQSGARIGATAGSDSHGATTPTVGMPTTWVFARSSKPRDLIAAIAAGRTTLSRLPPALGGARLLLEGDKDGDGNYESMVGDQVPPGTPLRVRAEGLTGAGLVRVRANGKTVANNEPLLPGGELKFKAPAEGGWVRATLYLADGTQAVDPGCLPIGQPLDNCSRDLAIAAMTSPIWVGKAVAPPAETPGGDAPPRTGSAPGDEPDSGPPLPAAQQAPASASLPEVPKKPLRGGALSRVAAKRTRACRRGTVPLRVSWTAADRPVEVQLWKQHAWKSLTRGARGRSYVLRARCGTVYRFRLRTRPAGRTPGPYRRVTARV